MNPQTDPSPVRASAREQADDIAWSPKYEIADENRDALRQAIESALTAAEARGRQQAEQELQGVIAADDERLRNAERRVFGPDVPYGCDAADHMADEVEALRAKVQQAEQALKDYKAAECSCDDCEEHRNYNRAALTGAQA